MVHSQSKDGDSKEGTEIPEDEQWRLIHDSGILGKVTSVSRADEVGEPLTLAEEIFNAIILIMPMSFLLLLMEICIHFQYGKHPTLDALVQRMVSGVPILSIFIFYTSRYKASQKMQLLLFASGVFTGSRLIYLINRGAWLVNMQQCPPLATIWVYTVIQLDLAPAVLSLGIVGAYVWWSGLRILP